MRSARVISKLSHRAFALDSQSTARSARHLSVPIPNRTPPVTTADDALSFLTSDTDVYVHNHASVPTELLDAMCRAVDERDLKQIRPSHIILNGKVPWAKEKYYGRIRSNCLFICGNLRKAVKLGQADYTPVFLYDIPGLFLNDSLNVDVALITISPPDERGFATLGPDVDCSLAAIQKAKKVIAIVNPTQPRTFGDSLIHISHIDALVNIDRPIYAKGDEKPNDVEVKIGQIIAENLVDNGSTLQLGIGAIPDMTLRAMRNHADLGIHTELLSDGVVELMQLGVINNSKKTVMPGKSVTSFAFGTRDFYSYLNNNEQFHFKPCNWTNNIDVIRQNVNMVSINSALEIDLTGQVVSDSIGPSFYSGFGGQVDFVYGASHAFDGKGKAIIALPSRTAKGQPKIVPMLKEGAGVVTTRAHVQYVVTEYGIADLYGKTVRQKAAALISISHPDDRAKLEEAAYKRLQCMPTLKL